MMVVNCKFEPGQWVALVHDPENKKRMITQIAISSDGGLRYNTTRDDSDMWHYESELVLWESKPVIIKDGEAV